MLMNNLADIFTFLKDINYLEWQDDVKTIFLVLTFIFLFLSIFSYIKAHLLVRRHRSHVLREREESHGGHEQVATKTDVVPGGYAEAWEHIQKFANSVREAEWKLSVIEADKFVDDVLKMRGFPGETMGERLMLIKPDELMSLQDLWDAHKLRNLLVHNAGYQIQHEQAISTVGAFERVLRELGVLQ